MKRKIWWRDSFMCWPSLRVQIHLLPWHWRLIPRGRYDYSPGHWKVGISEHRYAGWWSITGQWLAFEMDFGFNIPPFTLERETGPELIAHEVVDLSIIPGPIDISVDGGDWIRVKDKDE